MNDNNETILDPYTTLYEAIIRRFPNQPVFSSIVTYLNGQPYVIDFVIYTRTQNLIGIQIIYLEADIDAYWNDIDTLIFSEFPDLNNDIIKLNPLKNLRRILNSVRKNLNSQNISVNEISTLIYTPFMGQSNTIGISDNISRILELISEHVNTNGQEINDNWLNFWAIIERALESQSFSFPEFRNTPDEETLRVMSFEASNSYLQRRKSKFILFLSYRRDDSRWTTSAIYEYLHHNIKGRIFFDRASIPLSKNWKKEIRSGVREAFVTVVIIGKRWEKIKVRGTGTTRICTKGDVVAWEIAFAKAEGRHIIPIFVERNGKPPEAKDLPKKLYFLPTLQGLSITHEDYFHKMPYLLYSLVKIIRKSP